MYENFGPSIDTRQVTFTLFLPDNTVDPSQYVRGGSPKIKEIRVTGDFQKQLGGTDWELSTARAVSIVNYLDRPTTIILTD